MTTGTQPDDPALAVARAATRRHRAEVELVAAIARSPRSGLALLADLGLTDADVANLDALALLLAVRSAADRPGPVDTVTMAAVARELLASVDAWDAGDLRPFVTGEFWWGPGGVAAAFTSVPYDPATVRAAVDHLRAADRQQAEAFAAARGRSGVAA